MDVFMKAFLGNYHRSQRAITLLELLVVMVIIAIVATMVFPIYRTVRESSERVVCAQNLRSLYVSFSSYLQDHNQWPQLPEELLDEPEGAEEPYWMNAVKKYGAEQKVWLCPTLKRMYQEDPTKFSRNPKIHYLPTLFDEYQCDNRSGLIVTVGEN